jgi:mannose-6-phosphate isomerase-like protein (cupin superfamily)
MKPAYWLFGSHLTILADASTTGGHYEYTLGRHESGVQTPLHRHTAYSEHLFVLEGEYTAWVGDAVVVLKPGDDSFIPAGVVHTIKATGPGTSRGLNVSAPSGFVRLITGLGTPDTGDGPPPEAPPDPKKLARILSEIGDEILGPPGALPDGAGEGS